MTRRVGAVALPVLAAMVAALVAFDGWETGGFRATVYFEHIAGLREGAEVRGFGQRIGEVVAIGLVPARSHPARTAVVIRVDAANADRAPLNGAYFVGNRGIIGERYLAIGAPPGGVHDRGLRAGDEVRGIDPPIVDRAIWRSYRNLVEARRFAMAVAPEARELGQAIGELVATLGDLAAERPEASRLGDSLGELAEQIRQFAHRWDRAPVTWTDIAQLADRAGRTAADASSALAALRGHAALLSRDLARLRRVSLPPGARARLRASLARAERALGELGGMADTLAELASMVARGEGTIGGLLKDPEFPEDAKQLGRIVKRRPWRLIGRHRPQRGR